MTDRGTAAAARSGTGPASLLPYLASVHTAWLAEHPDLAWRQVDATLLFADISGFTPLTERLARRGKVGAEDLTHLLNSVFTELLSVAGGLGGDCLKFGGDALMLMFSGDRHAARAVEAAHAMQAALRPFRRMQTPAGRVSLGMSIGVHTGRPLLVLAGQDHRELLVVGPDVTRTLRAEAAASEGQVLVSEDVASLPLQQVVSDTVVRPADDEADVRQGVSAQLRSYLTGEEHEGEHRLVTVGFVQLLGVDDLLASGGPDTVADALDAIVSSVDRACTDHGVSFIASDVDKNAAKLIVAAGAPSTSSDDELRLVHALTQVLRDEPALSVRAGVARGRVFAVDLGSQRRRAFTLIGDAVNLAARIMANAEPGRLWVAADVLVRHRERVVARAIPSFTVKGKAAPVEALEVDATDTAVIAPVPTEAPIHVLGREVQLQQLRELMAQAQAGRGSLVEVVGEAGIGKSTLAAAAAAAARESGLDVAALEAGRYTQVTSYFPLRSLLRARLGLAADSTADAAAARLEEVVDELAPSLRRWLPLLGSALGLALPDTPETDRLEPAIRADQARISVATLTRALLTRPTLLLVEDAHWLDSATSAALMELCAQVASHPWVVLTTRRPDPGGFEVPASARPVHIELHPLSRDAAIELVRSGLAAAKGAPALPPGMAERLVERAAGNPLFLNELVAAAAAGEAAELPDSVEAVIASSIDTLAPQDRNLLRWAAVLGARFPVGVLAEMLDKSPAHVLRRLSGLTHFLDPADPQTVRFRHALLRDVAYEGLPFRRRRQLHELAGQILEQRAGGGADELAELLSTHFYVARQDAKCWHYSRIAGERSERTAAPIEAALFYRRALEAGRRLPHVDAEERAEVAIRLGDVNELSGRFGDARTAYRLAERLSPSDPLIVADLRRRTGVTWDHEGRPVNALRAYQRARAVLKNQPAQDAVVMLQARLAVAYGATRLRQGHYAQARGQLEAAVLLVGQTRHAEAYEVLAYAYRLLDWIDIETGVERDIPLRNLSLRLYDDLGDEYGRGSVLNNVGIAAYYRGDWDEAAEVYRRSYEAFGKAGAFVNQALCLNNIAELRSDQGHLAEAETLLREVLDVYRGSGSALLGAAMCNIGRTVARAGRLDEAAEWYQRARDESQRMHEVGVVLEADAREAERLVFAGAGEAALEAATAVAERATRLGGNPYVLMTADRVTGYALAQQGRLREAFSVFSRALMRSRENRADYEAALNLEGLGRVGRLLRVGSAEGFAEEAARLFARLGVVQTPHVPLPGETASPTVIEMPEQRAAVGVE